jgi:hypothetical protein
VCVSQKRDSERHLKSVEFIVEHLCLIIKSSDNQTDREKSSINDLIIKSFDTVI